MAHGVVARRHWFADDAFIGRELVQARADQLPVDVQDLGGLADQVRPPRTAQSGARSRPGKTGKGNPYVKGMPGEAAAAAARTDTFLGERYRRIVKRRGKLKAQVAIARTILVIIWHLLTDRAARYHNLGAGYYTSRIDSDRKARNHIRQLEALGFTVTLAPAA
jgi:transposase